MIRTEQDLHTYQTDAVRRLYDRDCDYLVAGVGAGKTIISLTTLLRLLEDGVVKHPLVIAPKNVAGNTWRTEHVQWAHTAHLKVSVVLGTPKQRIAALEAPDAHIHVATYDNIQWLVDQPAFKRFDCIVFDEASRLKNPKGKRSKALFKHMPQFKHVWGMSGTPRPQTVEDLFNQVKIIFKGKHKWGASYWKWFNIHFIRNQHTFKVTPRGPSVVGKLMDDFAAVSFKVHNSDIPRDAGETPVVSPFTLQPEERKHYLEMEKDFLTVLGTGRSVMSPNAAVVVNKLRQITSGFLYDTEQECSISIGTSRLDALSQLIDDLGGEAAIVAYQFKVEIAQLLKKYPNAGHIGSGVRNVPEIIDKWNAGDLDLLFIHPQSAGHGLNLQNHPTGRHLIWYGLPWGLEAYEQTIGRISRQGQKNPVVVHHLIDPTTIDQKVMNSLQAKSSFQQALIDQIKPA